MSPCVASEKLHNPPCLCHLSNPYEAAETVHYEREILLRLPAESLFRFRAVCKSWLRIIDDPSFVRTHTTNEHLSSPNLILFSTADGGSLKTFPLDSLNYINGQQTVQVRHLVNRGVPWMPMCNGLLLVSHFGSHKNWMIWNPLNDTLQQLPQLYYEKDRHLMGAGIGYDSNSDDYKVVRIDRIHHHNQNGALYRTLIYSLKSNSWKRAKDCPRHGLPIREALFFKGNLHWISSSTIVALDMDTEEYWLLPLPLPLMKGVHVNIDAFGGEYLVMTVDDSAWVMRGYEGEKPFWEELFSSEQLSAISGLGGLFPVAYNETKRQLILQNGNTTVRWDIEKRAVKRVTIDGLQNCHGIHSQLVVPGSLFRLKSGPAAGTRSAKRKRSKASERLKFTATTMDVFRMSLQDGQSTC